MASQNGVENLDVRSQNIQLRVGVTMVSLGLAAGVAMYSLGSGLAAHLLLVPLFFLGSYGIAAGLTRTCAFTALGGKRRTEQGPEPVADRRELESLRRRGTLLIALCAVMSVGAALLFALPSR